MDKYVEKLTSTCHNPVLGGFYPDPSICRVGPDFYLVNSTFAYFPGIPVFHSRDLIHWEQIGNAIHRAGQICYEGQGISRGLFAPTIRHHEGLFYILCTLVDGQSPSQGPGQGGNFIITAEDPAGPWSDPVWLSGAQGIDPSIFFDDDGKVWYTGTRPMPEGEEFSGDCQIWIQEIDLSLLAKGANPLVGESTGIWRGALRGAIWAEGPHIYKINDWYYLLYAEGGTSRDHAVCVARAKNIRGPWEGKKSNPIFTHRYLGKNADIVNVGHADLFDDTEGNWWMVLLASRPSQEVCPLGRETFMVPIFWEDGWPCVASRTGLIENEFEIPRLDRLQSNRQIPENACDRFIEKLPLHWLTLRMPANEQDAAFSLSARPGHLRLFTTAATMRGNEHPAFAGRRLQHKNWVFSAHIEFSPKDSQEAAGIILLQDENWQYRFEIFLAGESARGLASLRLVQATGTEEEFTLTADDLELEIELQSPLVLAACCEEMELSFFYGKDQYSLKPFPCQKNMRILSTEYSGGFVGTLAGVFATGNGKNTGNFADVSWAEYREI